MKFTFSCHMKNTTGWTLKILLLQIKCQLSPCKCILALGLLKKLKKESSFYKVCSVKTKGALPKTDKIRT